MAPKKVVSGEKKVSKTSGVPTRTFFRQRPPATGEQAESSTPASAPRPKAKTMSLREAATMITSTPASSDVELDVSLSQSSTQSHPETQDRGQQQSAAQESGQTQLPSTVQESGQAALVQESGQPQQPSTVKESGQQLVAVATPDVVAEQEVELPANQEAETPVVQLLVHTAQSRKRKGITATSSSSTTSDDEGGQTDMDWTPARSGRRQGSGRQGQRKVPDRLRVVEGGDSDDDNGEALIVEVETEKSSPAAPRGLPQVARPASIFLKPQKIPPTTTPVPTADTQVQKKTRPPTSSSSSGIGSGGRSKKFVSPVWDFFSISKEGEHIAICSLCNTNVSRGRPGTHLGTGGQSTHLKKHHGITWDQHLKKIAHGAKGEGSQGTPGPITVAGSGEFDDEEVGVDILSTHSTSVPGTQSVQSSHSATSEWHKTRSEAAARLTLSLPPAFRKSSASVAPEKRKTIQATIPGMFMQEGPYHRNHPTALRYNGKLAKMLALDLLPFSFVEGVGFLEFVAAICPKWRVPSRSYFARVAVPALHHQVLELISERLKKSAIQTIHLTTDMWTGCEATDYMCITAHWISFVGVRQKKLQGLTSEESYQSVRQHATVAMFSMNKAHTAANILQEFRRKVEEWLQPLGQRIGFVATDNGSNIVKAMTDGGYFRVLCLAHCINLVVQDFLKKEKVVSDLLATCRRICSHFNHSFKARKQLRIIQRQLRMPVKALIQEVPTRWNSTFYMLERLSDQRRAINEYVMSRSRDASVRSMTMEVADWNIVQCLTQMLLPVEVFTREVSKEDSTMGQAIPLLHMLRQQLEEERVKFDVEGDDENLQACDLASDLISCLDSNARLQNEIIHSEEYICATILDQRHKTLLSTTLPFNKDDVSKYKKWIVERAQKLEEQRLEPRGQTRRPSVLPTTSREASLASQQPITPSTGTPATQGPAKTSALSWYYKAGVAFSTADTTSKEVSAQLPAPMTIERMLDEYLNDTKRVFFYHNPFIYWHEKMDQWPELCRLAIMYLSCPISSVSSERVFSAAGAVLTVRRTSLSPLNVERLTMIKMNQHLIPPDFSVPESLEEEEEEEEQDSSWSSLKTDQLLGESTEFEDELCFPD